MFGQDAGYTYCIGADLHVESARRLTLDAAM